MDPAAGLPGGSVQNIVRKVKHNSKSEYLKYSQQKQKREQIQKYDTKNKATKQHKNKFENMTINPKTQEQKHEQIRKTENNSKTQEQN